MPLNPDNTAAKPRRSKAAGLSDRDLLDLFRAGSQDAAALIYERYAHRLRVLVRSHSSAALGSRCDPEDIVQSVFRRFFHRASQGNYEVLASAELWNLFLVIALNRLRAEEAYHRAAKRDVRLTAKESRPGSLLAQLEQLDPAAAFLEVVMEEALEGLPELHRQVVKLRIEGYEVAEIAEKTERSKRTVERVLQEARKQLSDLLPEQPQNEGK